MLEIVLGLKHWSLFVMVALFSLELSLVEVIFFSQNFIRD